MKAMTILALMCLALCWSRPARHGDAPVELNAEVIQADFNTSYAAASGALAGCGCYRKARVPGEWRTNTRGHKYYVPEHYRKTPVPCPRNIIFLFRTEVS